MFQDEHPVDGSNHPIDPVQNDRGRRSNSSIAAHTTVLGQPVIDLRKHILDAIEDVHVVIQLTLNSGNEMLDFSICLDIKSVHPDLVWFGNPTNIVPHQINQHSMFGRSLRSEIMSSRRSNSSASDAPRGAVPLIGAVV